MDSARQVIRWSIPGGVLLVYTVVYVVCASLILGVPAKAVRETIAPQNSSTGAVLLAVFSTVPVGYLVYQLYWSYFGKARSGVPLIAAVTGDRAAAIAAELPRALVVQLAGEEHVERDYNRMTYPFRVFRFKRVGFRRLHKEYRDSTSRRHYQDGVTQNLHLVRAVLTHIGTRLPTVPNEFTTLSDIYHSLGACRVAAVAALGPATALTVAAFHDDWSGSAVRSTVAVAVCIAIAVLTVGVLSGNRTRAWDAASAHVIYSIRLFNALPPLPEERRQPQARL